MRGRPEKLMKAIFVIVALFACATAAAESSPEELIHAATAWPWGGKNPIKLPPIPKELAKDIATEIQSFPAVRAAYEDLDANKRNTTWFAALEKLESEKAVWSLTSALCHPSNDVQIYALRALARVKDERVLPFLFQYADAMAFFQGGSESATIHGIKHVDIAKVFGAITGLEIKIDGQDPQGITAAVKHCREWYADRKARKP